MGWSYHGIGRMGREAVGGGMAALFLVREKVDVWKLVKEKNGVFG